MTSNGIKTGSRMASLASKELKANGAKNTKSLAGSTLANAKKNTNKKGK